MSIYTEINSPSSLQTACRVMEPAGISAALAEVGGDAALHEALSEELRLLFACPQVRPPSSGAKVLPLPSRSLASCLPAADSRSSLLASCLPCSCPLEGAAY